MHTERENPEGRRVGPERKESTPPGIAVMEPGAIEALRSRVLSDEKLRAGIEEANQELVLRQNGQQELADRDLPPEGRIPVREYLERHQSLIERFREHKVERWTRKWTENVRWSAEEEKGFAAAAREIGGGKFTEVIQIACTLKDGSCRKFVALSGGTEVTQEEIDKALGDIASLAPALESVHIVHNHPDLYVLTTIMPDDEEMGGFVTNDGLSERDIKFADDLSDKLQRQVPVAIFAICEGGLTYAYRGGTSEQLKRRL